MKSRKTWAFGESHTADSFLCKLLQWHEYIKHLELLDPASIQLSGKRLWLRQMQRKFLRKRRKSSEDDVGRSDLPLHCQPRVATGDLCILIYALSVRLRSSSCCSQSWEGAAVSRADGRAVLMPATLRREERAGKERLPQQGPLTAKTDSGWQEQKLSSYTSFSSIGMK